MGISDRLKEERGRLELTQAALADLVGITKKTQINWEHGISSPNAEALMGYQSAGVDVWYLLTGERAAPGVPLTLPAGVHASNGQLLLSLAQWATLLNLRAEHGQGRPLLWCEALFQVLDGYTPSQPLQLAAQRYTAAVKHGRSREGIALYLVRNQPSAPWLVWPEGCVLQEVYALDMGEDTLPLFVPDTHRLPAPALLLSELELSHLNMGQTLLVDWHGAGTAMRDGNRGADSAEKTTRAIKRAFVGKWDAAFSG